MDLQVVIAIAVVVSLVLLRHLAARRVAARQGQFVWLMFEPSLLIGFVVIWASIQIITLEPLVGVFALIGGVVYLAVAVRFLIRLSRAVSSAGTDDDMAAVTEEPFVDYMSTLVGLGLTGGLVAVFGLIVWGVIQAAR